MANAAALPLPPPPAILSPPWELYSLCWGLDFHSVAITTLAQVSAQYHLREVAPEHAG